MLRLRTKPLRWNLSQYLCRASPASHKAIGARGIQHSAKPLKHKKKNTTKQDTPISILSSLTDEIADASPRQRGVKLRRENPFFADSLLRPDSAPTGSQIQRRLQQQLGQQLHPLQQLQQLAELVNVLPPDTPWQLDQLEPPWGRFGPDSMNLMLAQDWDNIWDFYPDIDVAETDTAIVITADLPGVEKDHVEVRLDDARNGDGFPHLTIKGNKKSSADYTKKKNTGDVKVSERSVGSFHRLISLPKGIISAKSAAKFKNGVLIVKIPKSKAEGEDDSRGKLVKIEDL